MQSSSRLDEDIITAEYHEQYAIKPHFIAQHEQTKLDNLTFKKKRNRYLTILLIVIAVPALGSSFTKNTDLELVFFLINGRSLLRLGLKHPRCKRPLWTKRKRKFQKTTRWKRACQPAEPAETVDPVASDPEPQNQQGSESEDLSAKGIRPWKHKPAGLPNKRRNTVEEPQIEEPVYLPVIRLEDVLWTPPENQGNEIEDMFAIEGLARVWVKVTVDGVVLTALSGQRYGSILPLWPG